MSLTTFKVDDIVKITYGIKKIKKMIYIVKIKILHPPNINYPNNQHFFGNVLWHNDEDNIHSNGIFYAYEDIVESSMDEVMLCNL